MPKRQDQDPYAPPPRHRDHSGAVLRVAIIAGLLGAAAWGYMTFAPTEGEQTAMAPAEDQQLADAGYATSPEAAPPAESAATTPPPAAAPAPAPRRSAPAAPPPAEPVPPPSTSSSPPTTPAPIPPVDVPPSG